MSKRKRNEDSISDSADPREDQALRIRKSRFQAKLAQGHKSLTSALKLARGFERQKLGRRQKSARDDGQTLLKLKEEIIVLKALDLGKTAERHLLKQMVKTKRIKESSVFVSSYGADPKVQVPKSDAEANMLGRLFNSNPVKEIMPRMMEEIYHVLGLDNDKAKRGKNLGGTKEAKQGKILGDEESDAFEGFSERQSGSELSDEEESDLRDDDEDIVDDENFPAYNDRLAPSPEEIASQPEDESLSEGSETSPKPGQNHARDPPHQTNKAPKQISAVNTAFLPTLAMTGYYSGSESSDDEGSPNAYSAIPQQRNNRRGQRARQQIAEKKFGKNAKHLLKARAEGLSGKVTWDAKRGAISGQKLKSKGRWGRQNTNGPTGANGEAVVSFKVRELGKKATTNEASIHPSWEAAKKRKEQAKKVTDVFVGKKTTFD